MDNKIKVFPVKVRDGEAVVSMSGYDGRYGHYSVTETLRQERLGLIVVETDDEMSGVETDVLEYVSGGNSGAALLSEWLWSGDSDDPALPPPGQIWRWKSSGEVRSWEDWYGDDAVPDIQKE